MSTTEGTSTGSTGDSALEGALSEMASEGTFSADSTFESESGGTSQGTDSASATTAAPIVPPGDSGSVQAVASSTASAPTGADPAADPLAGTEPFTYGEGKTLSGVYRVPGEGLMVPEAHVASVTQLAERADHLDRVTRELTDQNTAFERLSSWTVRDSEGKEQTVTGPQGLEAMRVEHARQSSLIAVVDSILTDPSKILGLLARDEQGKIVVDPAAVETLQMRAQLAADAAERTARAQFTKLGTPAAPSAPTSHAGSAPPIIKSAAGANFAALLPEDHQLLAEQLDRYVRPVTEEDRRYDPTKRVGQPIVDASFAKVVQHLAAQRAGASAKAKAAESSGKFNGGMERGRQPAKAAAPKAPAAQPAKADERKPKADWESPLNAALAELGVSR